MSRCDECGRFAQETRDVFKVPRGSGPDHEACQGCRPELFEEDN